MSVRPRALAAVAIALAASPFAYLALLSVAGRWEYPRLLPASLRVDRWSGLLGSENDLLASLWVSLAVSAAVGLVSTTAGFVTARAIADHRRRKALLALAYLPMATSPVILGVCLMYFYIRLGLVATLAGVVLAHVIFAYAFAVVFWVPFWNAEKRAYEDLVRTLGGRPFDLYRRVLLPLSREAFALCLFQTFLISWFQYGLTLLVGSGKVETLPLEVYDYVYEADLGYAAVASCLLLLPPVLLSWVNRRILRSLV
ncbi:MAG: ABC transporter permease [Vicinamibacteria bacterium]